MAGMKACCVVLYLGPRSCSGLAGSRICHHDIKRQRPRLDERFAHKCCMPNWKPNA